MLATSALPSGPRRIVLLGSTGSIGTQTLDVVDRLGPARAQVIALAANRNVSLLAEQARITGAKHVAVADASLGPALETALGDERRNGSASPTAAWGHGVLSYLAALPEADTVVVAIAGFAGLRATMAAVEAGKRVCIATKEVLVAAGALVMESARRHGATILPMDSEHSAIFQCIRGYDIEDIERLWLTASGGPFRTWTPEQISNARPDEALNHPIWRMGGKISIDSATLMNKGLEIIEAHHLFGIPMDSIEVVLHPQSIVHSLVEMRDGSILSQMGLPDMRLAIQIALMSPEKFDTGLPRLRVDEIGKLTWEKPDHERFPAINLARRAVRAGGTAPATLNAANEAAVSAFLAEQIGFDDIAALVERALDDLPCDAADSVSTIEDADRAARAYVTQTIAANGAAHLLSDDRAGVATA